MTIPAEFISANYLNLATFRKDGRQVNTPVWFASDDQFLYVYSEGKAGKVKRLRNSGQAKVAACTVTGKLTGNWHSASAELLDTPEAAEQVQTLLKQKYGMQYSTISLASRMAGKINKRAFIRISL